MKLRSPKPRLLTGLVLLALAATAVWFAASGEDEAGPAARSTDAPIGVDHAFDPGSKSDSALSTAPSHPAAADQVRTVGSGASPADPNRQAVSKPGYSARLVDTEGHPIPGAQVSWTTLDAGTAARGVDAWKALEQRTEWATTDADGRFLFDTPRSAGDHSGSVIWATHPDFEAAPRVLGPDFVLGESGPELVLRHSRGMRCRVVEGDRSVPGAQVVQYGVVPQSSKLGRPPGPKEQARAVLFRKWITASDAAVRLAPFPAELTVHATKAELASSPWQGATRDTLTLELGSTITAEGIATLRDGEDAGGELLVDVSAFEGNIQRALGLLKVAPDGSFGPVRLPLLSSARYAFRLHGGGAVPTTAYRDPPGAGERLFLELKTYVGNDVWFSLWDVEGEIIPSGTIEVLWSDGIQNESLRAAPRDDAYFFVRGCPDGSIVAVGSAPGYGVTRIGPYSLPEAELFTHGMELMKAGRLEGRVLAAGVPVSDFEVVVWPTTDHLSASKLQFTGREDGSFTLENAPLGEVSLLAASPQYAGSRLVSAEVSPDQTTQVLIELEGGVLARGRVTGPDGNGIPMAVVQPYYSQGQDLLLPLGLQQPVERDGTFGIARFPSGKSYFEVLAPGYSTQKIGAQGVRGQVLELGTIVLTPRQDLEVRLLLEEGMDPTGYTVASVPDEKRLSFASFSPQGIVRYEAVVAGTHHLDLFYPDGSSQVTRVELRPGEPWIVELEVRGTARLTVELEPPAGEKLSGRTRVMLTYENSVGRDGTRFIDVPPDGKVVIEGVPAGEVMLGVDESTLSQLASRMITVGEGEEVFLHIALGRAERFRVLDGDKNGVPSVRVALYDGTGEVFYQSEITDAEGYCTFKGLPDLPLRIGLSHDVLGEAWGLNYDPLAEPGELDDPERVVEIEFRAEASIEAQLLDGEEPLAGVAARLHERIRGHGITIPQTSDAEGRVGWTRLGAGPFRLVVREEGYWPVKTVVQATLEPKMTVVQVRRLGDLRFTIQTAAGIPVAGQAVEVTSTEFETSVSTWLEEGRIQSEPDSLATDGKGRLVLEGLPRGSYTWRVTFGEDTFEGSVEVPPGDETVVQVFVP